MSLRCACNIGKRLSGLYLLEWLLTQSPKYSMLRTVIRSVTTRMSNTLAAIPNVDIDPNGVFKYILIKVNLRHLLHCNSATVSEHIRAVHIQVTDKSTSEKKLIVRGYGNCGYHADILDEVQRVVGGGIRYECLGGGRIEHDAQNKKINVYGYSQASDGTKLHSFQCSPALGLRTSRSFQSSGSAEREVPQLRSHLVQRRILDGAHPIPGVVFSLSSV